MSQEKQGQIRSFCEENSRVSPYRVLKRLKTNGEPTNVKFLTCSEAQLVREYNKAHPANKICKTIFHKYMPQEFKKARRDQDKCDDCWELKKLNIKVRKELKPILLQCKCLDSSNVSNIIDDYCDDTPYEPALANCSHIASETKEQWRNVLNMIKEVQYHRQKAKIQRQAYHNDFKRSQTTAHQMLIVVDWKENYTMKGGTIATGRDFYQNVQVSIMGVIIVCKEIENGKPQYLPIVSNVLTHDGTTARMNTEIGLNKVKTEYPVAFEELETITVWADSGPTL